MPHPRQPWKLLSAGRVAGSAQPYACTPLAQWVGKLCSGPCKTCLAILLVALLGTAHGQAFGEPGTADAEREAHAQRIVDVLRDRLGITAAVSVTIVDRDPRVVSVRSRRDGSGGFALSVERRFAATVSEAQLQAALAHELGHVWIATHHPYLQTEQLANRVAMRVVSREQLVEVYRALWGAEALHGNLETFLGVQAKAEQ